MEQTIDVVANTASGSAARRHPRRFASGPEGALIRLQTRWPWVLAAALVGAMLGLMLTRGPVTYQTSAILQIVESSQDSGRTKQVAQTVERTVTSSTVVEDAAGARGILAADLTARMSAQWETDTDLVYVTVRGTDRQGVVNDANAVVTSLVGFYEVQTIAQIKELRSQGNKLLATGRLNNTSAEAARRSGIGSSVASQQGSASSGSTTVTLLDPAKQTAATGMSVPVAVVLGGFVGTALSGATALLLPFRRRKVRRAAEVPVLMPGVRGVSAADNGAAEVVGLFLESERSDLAVLAMEGAEDGATSFGADLVVLLEAHGVSAAVAHTPGTLNRSPPSGGTRNYSNLGEFAFLGRSARAETRRELGASALVLVTPAKSGVLSLLAGQGEVLAVVMARAGRQTVHELGGVARQLGHSDPTVVLLT